MSLLNESRYDRQERISWWDQTRLRQSNVLVVGAGALGNELVKNLVLLGIGRIDVVDMDLIEHTNLARCVFFREGDEGKPKAEALAAAAQRLNADVQVRGLVGTVQSLGSGLLAEYDVVLGGLDNREARLWVNRACRRLGLYWIDGAIEGLHGTVQCFAPTGACYECTLTEVDWQILSHRRSCALLGVQEMMTGKTPTNATTASVVAGLQVQEAIKLLVGKADMLALVGRQWNLLGEQMASFTSIIDEDQMCMAHDEILRPSQEFRAPATLRDVMVASAHDVSTAVLDFSDDFLMIQPCAQCNTGGGAGLRAMLESGEGSCPSCHQPLETSSRSSLGFDDPLLDLAFSELAWPQCELLHVREADDRIGVRVWRAQ